MLAKILGEGIEKCQSDVPNLVNNFRRRLYGIYKKFTEEKFELYQRVKGKSPKDNEVMNDLWKPQTKRMIKVHQLLALRALFTEKQFDLFLIDHLLKALSEEFEENQVAALAIDLQLPALKALCSKKHLVLSAIKSHCAIAYGKLSRIGLVEVTSKGKLQFINKTYTHYYVADFIGNELTKGKITSPEVVTFILNDIFLTTRYQLIRAFLDGLLSESKPSEEVLKQYGNRTHQLWEDGELQLPQTVREGNDNITRFLLDSLLAAGHTDTVNQLLAKDDGR
jgi:hypothetical protein